MRKEASLENNHDRYFDNSRKSSAVDKKSDPAGDRWIDANEQDSF